MSPATPTPPHAPTERFDGPGRAVVDLAAIRDNVAVLRDHAPKAQVMAVVKADAYGHGLVPVARAALAGGASWLGVAQPAEALALRAAGVGAGESPARILAWLCVPGSPFADLLAADVDVSVAAPWALAEVVDAARTTGRTARIHLEVETGLGRGGVPMADLPALLAGAVRAQRDGLVRVVGIWSHLAFADEPGHPTIGAQRAAFDDAVRLAEAAGADLEVRHLANSAAVLTDPATHYDLVRPGIAVYGLSPAPQFASGARFGLTPAMTLEARLSLVKSVGAGHGVSYAHHYVTGRDTVLGVVPLGYADGIPRHASGGGPGVGSAGGPGASPVGAPGGPVLVSDRIARVAGRVCMDQFVLDLGPGAGERAGDVVTLFGAGAGIACDGVPTAEDWAVAAGTISYEIVTRIGVRVPRVYVDTADRAANRPGLAASNRTDPAASATSASATSAPVNQPEPTPAEERVP